MRKTLNIFITIVFLSTLLLSLVGYIYAVEKCPESMSTQERYLCLQKELSKLESSEGSLQKKLKNEDYQQLSLKEKIQYLTTQISQNEKVIETLQIEVLAQDIEINMLSKEITDKEDNVNILNQEIKTLERTVNERVRESYKYSYVGALEFLFDVKDLDSILRKTKYLIETRLRDKNSLVEYSDKMATLEEEELALSSKKAELQIKRNIMEEEKIRLEEEKKNLDSQKSEKASLLAESQRREAAYKKELAETTAAISSIDDQISELVIKLFAENKLGNGAPVYAGQPIARQGHTGCSFGSHLHFDIRTPSGTRVNPFPSYLTLSGGYIYGNKYQPPISRAYLTQGFRSGHLAIDMVSVTEGNQNLERYEVPYGLCSVVDNMLNCRRYGYSYCSNKTQPPREDWNLAYLTGEGAPIRAISSGRVYYGIESTWHGKYALVVHDDGYKSFYLHIQ